MLALLLACLLCKQCLTMYGPKLSTIIPCYCGVALQARTDLVTSCDCCPGHVDQLFETRCQLMLSFDASLDA